MNEQEEYTMKLGYWGFSEAHSNGVYELMDHLGLRADPTVRLFEYSVNPRLEPLLRPLAKVGFITIPLKEFLLDRKFRGQYAARENVIFVRKGDIFAECHEYGHVFVDGKNPSLVSNYIRGHRRRQVGEIDDCVALYALDEGMSQWMAIQVGLKTKALVRVSEAIEERNKLRVGSKDEVIRRIMQLKTAIDTYVQDRVVRRGASPLLIQRKYEELLTDNLKLAMSLGYIYVDSRATKLLQSDLSIEEALSLIITQPPTLIQLEEEIIK